jgi:two-component sensor histidine kinase
LSVHRNGTGRFDISGPSVTLGSQQALSLSLAVHELATNAIKYGALSNEDGKIKILWSEEEAGGDGTFFFSWTETGGPLVVTLDRKGFGTLLIARILAGDFGGDVKLGYEPTGFTCHLIAPVGHLYRADRRTGEIIQSHQADLHFTLARLDNC